MVPRSQSKLSLPINFGRQASEDEQSSSGLSSAPPTPQPQQQREVRGRGRPRKESTRANARFSPYPVPSRAVTSQPAALQLRQPRASAVVLELPSEQVSSRAPTARKAPTKQPKSTEDDSVGANDIQIYRDSNVDEYDHLKALLEPIRVIVNTLFEYAEDKPVTSMTAKNIRRPWNTQYERVTLYTLERKSHRKYATGMDVFTTEELKKMPIWLRRGILKKHCSDLVVLLCMQAVKDVLYDEADLVEWTINYPKHTIYFVDKGQEIDDNAQQSAILVTSHTGEEYVVDFAVEQFRWGINEWFSNGYLYMQNCVRKKDDSEDNGEKNDGDPMDLDGEDSEEVDYGMIHEDDEAQIKKNAEEDDWFVTARKVIDQIWIGDNIHEYRALADEDRGDFWVDLVRDAWKEIEDSD